MSEKELTFENRHVNLFDFEHWRPDYIKLNPKGVVPALDHDGHIVIESNVIIEYLEDVFPEIKLRPKDAASAAKMRLWIFNSEDIAHPYVNLASYNPRHATRLKKKRYSVEELTAIAAACPNPIIAARFVNRQLNGVSVAEEEAAYGALDYLLGEMELALSPGPWLCGQVYSLADIAMAPYVSRIEVLRRPELVSAARRPRVADWWQRIRGRSAFKEAFSLANPDKTDPIQR